MIAKDITDLIGNTPMLEISRFAAAKGLKANLYAKLEYKNPCGSIKDRVALSMIEDAESKGTLKAGGTIIEPTSGNTGIGLAMVAAVRGYKLMLTMPKTMSVERRKLLKALGARIELTPGNKGMQGAIERADELNRQIAGSIILQQFDNPANPAAHVRGTALEIIRQMNGKVDAVVATVGTGGTVSGIGKTLKALLPEVKIFAVEPAESAVLNGGQSGPHVIQGIGAGFIPRNYDSSVVDKVIDIKGEEAFKASRLLAVKEGFLAGISSGAALAAACEVAAYPEFENKNIVVILPDTGERYLSTALFEE